MLIKPITRNDIKKYDCIFFDFDGVVLESGNIKTEAFFELYIGTGVEEEVRKHHLENQGVSRYEKFKWIAENLLNQSHTEEDGKILGEQFSDLIKSKILAASFVPGFPEMIRYIRERDIYTVVASGTPEEELRGIVKDRQLSSYFDEVYGSPKTKSEIVREVLDRKKIEPLKCLFFGDASTDHQAANNTKVDFCARLTTELSAYWESVDYKYGAFNFSDI